MSNTSNDDRNVHDSDDEPMNFEIPQDYAAAARECRAKAIAHGAGPSKIVLMSEVEEHVGPRGENEGPGEYAMRYSHKMNSMIRAGIQILNDTSTADVKPNGFGIGGIYFDLSRATKREYREFTEWHEQQQQAKEERGQQQQTTEERDIEIPEPFLKFQTGDPQQR